MQNVWTKFNKTNIMRQTLLIFFTISSLFSFGQKLEWIPFNWEGDSVSGKYFDKLAITIPVTIDNIPHKFNMQFDLGAVETHFYGNAIKPYLDSYKELATKFDTASVFWIQGQKNHKFKSVNLNLGKVPFGKRDIGLFENFGDSISIDSINTSSEKHIGTIAPDLFLDKVLIIDYPNKRICVTDNIPKEFSNATFQKYKIEHGRIKIPLTINGKKEDLMFDTGSSLFALITTKANATNLSSHKVSDSLKISSWGVFYTLYGKMTSKKIQYGTTALKPVRVYYDEHNRNDKFYEQEKIWGITGNAYFLNNVVIIDYKRQQFGVK